MNITNRYLDRLVNNTGRKQNNWTFWRCSNLPKNYDILKLIFQLNGIFLSATKNLFVCEFKFKKRESDSGTEVGGLLEVSCKNLKAVQ